MKKIIRKLFGNSIYSFFQNTYLYIKNPIFFKRFFYNSSKDLSYNEKLCKKMGFDITKIKSVFNKHELDNYAMSLWSYYIIAAISNAEKLKILEIGTLRGGMTNFMASVFPNSEVYTVELPNTDGFNQNMKAKDLNMLKEDKEKIKKNLIEKKNNLNKSNIYYSEIDSFYLHSKFEENQFDLIFVDGDHSHPQVTIDLFQSYNLCKKGGCIIVDDVMMLNSYQKKHAPEQNIYLFLEKLSEKGLLETNYFVQRIYKTNSFNKKYVSYSIKT